MKKNKFKVLIADDHTLFRESLTALVARWDDFEIIGDVSSGDEAIEFCKTSVPDIVLMDICMPGKSGLDAGRYIIQMCPGVKLVMLTMSADENDVFEAFREGACGYILKDVSGTSLHGNLLDVAHGKITISSSIAAKILSEFGDLVYKFSQPKHLKDFQELTIRERDILRLLVEGLSNCEIGLQLHISEQTVKKI
ncbi:MAG: response regulator transcription factor [Peptococcaceae bacterium]|nr:response regulator transcription factor [Peptococcaceae bacterium]